MKIMRRARTVNIVMSILLLTPLTVWGQQGSSASGDILTLEQAITLALSDNHLVKIPDLEVGKGGDNLAATRTLRLPSMNLFSLTSKQLVQHDVNLNTVTSDLLPGIDPFAPV